MLKHLLALTLIATPAFAADDTHLSEADGVRLLHAWTNATEEDHANVYIEIDNTSDTAVTLIGGTTDIAEEVVLMGAAMKAGGEGSKINAIPIGPGSEFTLDPEGVFLHLDGLNGPLLKGEEFEMMVTFEPIGTIEVHVEIEDEHAHNHSHAGHNH